MQVIEREVLGGRDGCSQVERERAAAVHDDGRHLSATGEMQHTLFNYGVAGVVVVGGKRERSGAGFGQFAKPDVIWIIRIRISGISACPVIHGACDGNIACATDDERHEE